MAGLRVLLVDDEVELVTALAERLEMRGYAVDALTSGSEALELIAKREYDVAVVDLKMPGVDGIAVLAGIKKERPALPVILLTGRGPGDDDQANLEHAAAAYLVKPVQLDVLMDAMAAAAGGKAHE